MSARPPDRDSNRFGASSSSSRPRTRRGEAAVASGRSSAGSTPPNRSHSASSVFSVGDLAAPSSPTSGVTSATRSAVASLGSASARKSCSSIAASGDSNTLGVAESDARHAGRAQGGTHIEELGVLAAEDRDVAGADRRAVDRGAAVEQLDDMVGDRLERTSARCRSAC